MYSLDDTIAAIASPPGGAARGVVRLSGPTAWECVEGLFRGAHAPSSRRVVAGELHLPGLHSPLPCELYVWDRRSYTGQPVVEIHTLGSPPLLQFLVQAVCAAGARPAGPGEFTLRAFLSGRIDLSQAEAVLGVIDAADPRSLRVALNQLAGGLSRPFHRLRDALLDLLAHVEAGFDFADEDIPPLANDVLNRRLADVAAELADIQRRMDARGESLHAVTAVLIGRPNVGKSSLFNALAGDRAALVADVPGTTRDYLVAELDLDGIRCRLIDTAGIEEARWATEDAEVAAAADRIAVEQHRAADVQILCLDSTRRLDNWECDQPCENDAKRIIVFTKCDDDDDGRGFVLPHGAVSHCDPVFTSAVTGRGLDVLRTILRQKAMAGRNSAAEVVAETAVRCRDSLRLAVESVERARRVAAEGRDELVAAELRVILDALGRIVGAVYTDDLLDRIFSRFCVGK